MGENGEIVARGSRMMAGYWHQESATRDTMRGGWIYTGDLGYQDEDGYIYLSGRAKDFIKRGGEMISPEEVEQVLRSHPELDDAAVIGVPDDEAGELPKAFIVAAPNSTPMLDELQAFMSEHVASYKLVREIEMVDAIPKSPSGKILRRELRA